MISAEATIISSLERNESRGAHQRSDFKEIDNSLKFNCVVKINKETQKLIVNKLPLKKLSSELEFLVKNNKTGKSTKNKLLE